MKKPITDFNTLWFPLITVAIIAMMYAAAFHNERNEKKQLEIKIEQWQQTGTKDSSN